MLTIYTDDIPEDILRQSCQDNGIPAPTKSDLERELQWQLDWRWDDAEKDMNNIINHRAVIPARYEDFEDMYYSYYTSWEDLKKLYQSDSIYGFKIVADVKLLVFHTAGNAWDNRDVFVVVNDTQEMYDMLEHIEVAKETEAGGTWFIEYEGFNDIINEIIDLEADDEAPASDIRDKWIELEKEVADINNWYESTYGVKPYTLSREKDGKPSLLYNMNFGEKTYAHLVKKYSLNVEELF